MLSFQGKVKMKKGQAAEGLVDAISILAFVLTALIFFMLLQIRGCGRSSSLSVNATNGADVTANNLMLAYVRYPLTVGNENISMGTLIIKWFLTDKDNPNKKKYEDILNKETQDFLDFIPYCSEINVYNEKTGLASMNNQQPIFTVVSKYCDPKNYYYDFTCSIMQLPRISKEKNLKVSACVGESKTYKSSVTVPGH